MCKLSRNEILKKIVWVTLFRKIGSLKVKLYFLEITNAYIENKSYENLTDYAACFVIYIREK